MAGHWFTDKLPWRFLVLRRTYWKNIRIAAVAPEIKGEVNRNAFYLACQLWVYLPAFVLLSPFIAMRWLGELVLEARVLRFLPDFERLRQQSVEDANRKVTPDEVRARLGLQEPRILSKKSDVPEPPVTEE